MHIHYLQHIALETPGCILNWAAVRGHVLSRTAFFAGESLPDVLDFDLLLIMGGPMNVHEEDAYPWLADEKAFIGKAIREGKAVLGICLGAQLWRMCSVGRLRADNILKSAGCPSIGTERHAKIHCLQRSPSIPPYLNGITTPFPFYRKGLCCLPQVRDVHIRHMSTVTACLAFSSIWKTQSIC